MIYEFKVYYPNSVYDSTPLNIKIVIFIQAKFFRFYIIVRHVCI